jgi:galactoside O-acetyltransferase
MAFLSREQLRSLGLRSFGNNVLISDRASIHGAARIDIGDHVRIDDFCILSAGVGGISFGSYIHVGCYSSLIGKETITIRDLATISSRVSIYSSTDDFSGEHLISPMAEPEHTHVTSLPIEIGKYSVLGAGSILLPGAQVAEGSALGSMTLLKHPTEPYAIYVGCPARFLRARDTRCRDLAMGAPYNRTHPVP